MNKTSHWLTMVTLCLLASTAGADIQDSDFWFHNEGQAIFINGAKGAPLHIDYIGPALTKPLKVRIMPTNPALKVNPSVCTFTKKDDDCRLTVHLSKAKEKVYGIHQFEVTEIGSKSGEAKPQIVATDTETVGFGVGVQNKDMPKPMPAFWTAPFNYGGLTQKVIITNATNYARDYQATAGVYFRVPACGTDGRDYGPGAYGTILRTGPSVACAASTPEVSVEAVATNRAYNVSSDTFTLNSHTSCYLDYSTITSLPAEAPSSKDYAGVWYTGKDNFVSDITVPDHPIYNGFGGTGNNNISSCSAIGNGDCASNQWGSWTVGLANLGAKDMDGGVRSGQVEVLQNNSWNNGGYIYWKEKWHSENLALVHIQGSIDGSENWDAKAAVPSILEIQSAPPCSYYLKVDPKAVYSVSAQVFGPGSITMPEGGQCTKYITPGLDFIYCTGGGYKNAWYEMTAVPEAGKTFKGWSGGNGECNSAGPTCRFRLSSDIRFKANFE
jgi:hypothetical protein